MDADADGTWTQNADGERKTRNSTQKWTVRESSEVAQTKYAQVEIQSICEDMDQYFSIITQSINQSINQSSNA
eukprot:5101895-Lingulodinium_polyedra.AAC.1